MLHRPRRRLLNIFTFSCLKAAQPTYVVVNTSVTYIKHFQNNFHINAIRNKLYDLRPSFREGRTLGNSHLL